MIHLDTQNNKNCTTQPTDGKKQRLLKAAEKIQEMGIYVERTDGLSPDGKTYLEFTVYPEGPEELDQAFTVYDYKFGLDPTDEDEEPNIRWDAAVGLAKMGEKSSIPIIENLMDRKYLMTFPELDYNEINKVILDITETARNPAGLGDTSANTFLVLRPVDNEENFDLQDF